MNEDNWKSNMHSDCLFTGATIWLPSSTNSTIHIHSFIYWIRNWCICIPRMNTFIVIYEKFSVVSQYVSRRRGQRFKFMCQIGCSSTNFSPKSYSKFTQFAYKWTFFPFGNFRDPVQCTEIVRFFFPNTRKCNLLRFILIIIAMLMATNKSFA